jgi:GNAT superfamily N-acetyltransferase
MTERTEDVVVRRAGPDDWERWREIRLAALADSPAAFGSTLERELGFDEGFWRERLGHPDNHSFFAELDGQLVGIAAGYLRPDERGPDGVIAELVAMWVRPEVRGRGVAGALVEAVSKWAREQGRPELRLFVSGGNDAAERVYERVGFERNGFSQPMPRDPDRFEYEMSRQLDSADPTG